MITFPKFYLPSCYYTQRRSDKVHTTDKAKRDEIESDEVQK